MPLFSPTLQATTVGQVLAGRGRAGAGPSEGTTGADQTHAVQPAPDDNQQEAVCNRMAKPQATPNMWRIMEACTHLTRSSRKRFTAASSADTLADTPPPAPACGNDVNAAVLLKLSQLWGWAVVRGNQLLVQSGA